MRLKLPSIIVPITLATITYINPRVGISLFMGIYYKIKNKSTGKGDDLEKND